MSNHYAGKILDLEQKVQVTKKFENVDSIRKIEVEFICGKTKIELDPPIDGSRSLVLPPRSPQLRIFTI